MRYSPIFRSMLNCSTADEVFSYLMGTLNDSITYWDYFVNWHKVRGSVKDLEMDLNTLNYLVGKENIEEEFKLLLRRQPSIVRLIPVLLACRESSFKILTDYTGGVLRYEDFDFQGKTSLTLQDIDKACRFAKETGLLELFKHKIIKSVPDYVIGVEVGLDSNGRKNRGGTTMEKIVESLLEPICTKHEFALMKQATAAKVSTQWGMTLHVDKSDRHFDFAVTDSKTLYLIETNYYGGGGSKLKATAGEYKALFDFVSPFGHRFIWITDGQGWQTTRRPLEETFNHVDYILNLRMVMSGILAPILAGTP